MSLKSFKPTTPSNRYKVLPSFDEITKSKPEKALLEPIRKSGGRNNNGRITTRHIGGPCGVLACPACHGDGVPEVVAGCACAGVVVHLRGV